MSACRQKPIETDRKVGHNFKMRRKLIEGFSITRLRGSGELNTEQVERLTNGESDEQWFCCTRFPQQVHETLIAHGVIENSGLNGHCETFTWVAQSDWVYRCEFLTESIQQGATLAFEGLDTLCTIYFNGQKIGTHADMYLPVYYNVQLQKKNVLLLHFLSPEKYLESYELQPQFENVILKRKTLRKAQHDFDGYLGAKPYATPIGVFSDIMLLTGARIEDVHIRTWVKHDLHAADVMIDADIIDSCGEECSIRATLSSPEGEQLLTQKAQRHILFRMGDIELWYPTGLGKQPLYMVRIELLCNGQMTDIVEKRIGFRDVRMVSPFRFEINGLPIRLWGANFAPLDGISHCFNKPRFDELMTYVLNGNMNTLRIWGEGIPYPDLLYDFADEHGILLWMDFFGESKMHPDTPEFIAQCAAEAEVLVKRLRHRPSILLWCGGNEMEMWAEIDHPGMPKIGEEIYKHAYREVCARYDPERVYVENSPYGGTFANDPLMGDTHGYDHHSCYVPGINYPMMFSENTRIAPPSLRSMQRFMTDEEIFPEGFYPSARPGRLKLVPETWEARSADRMTEKFGPLESFYDATNAEELICYTAAARALQLRQSIERCRRGRPTWERECRCFGHMVWKLNDTWPQIYTAIIDYYLEPYLPYYALKRAYAPVLLSFDKEDHITLWLTNDTPQTITGKLYYGTFHLQTQQHVEHCIEVDVPPFVSAVVADYSEFGQLDRREVLTAHLTLANGETLESIDFLDTDRYLNFPDAVLSVHLVGENMISVSSDRFAHGVQLEGDDGGDLFGWHFEDNDFDLLPHQSKMVRILGRHHRGIIRAKTRYGTNVIYMEV